MVDKNPILDGARIPTRLRNFTLEPHEDKRLENPSQLGRNYIIHAADVVCTAQGAPSKERIYTGNNRFNVLVDLSLGSYNRAETRKQKSVIVRNIVDAVRKSGGKFIREQDGLWQDVGNVKAREKASTAIRNKLSKKRKGGAAVRRDGGDRASPETSLMLSHSADGAEGTKASVGISLDAKPAGDVNGNEVAKRTRHE
mmetsp:Transcript_2924/g.5932  ORF Transcript_2924/g.5932 Transcript_2924/m.5932 type:complete len:198 (+) Transcript_2924:315-908(+)